MTSVVSNRVTGCNIPGLNTAIAAGRCEQSAVGAEGHAANPALGLIDERAILPGGDVPELQLAGTVDQLPSGRREESAIGAEGHAPDDADMAAQGVLFSAGHGIEDLDLAG